MATGLREQAEISLNAASPFERELGRCDVARDGKRYVSPRSIWADAPTVVVVNWLGKLK